MNSKIRSFFGKKIFFSNPFLMKSAAENRKLSLAECKKTLNTGGLCYTDEEVLKIRDWLYHMADIAIDAIDKNASTVAFAETRNETNNKGKP